MTIISLYPILIALSLSFFLSFILPAMINLFKKNIHSLLGFSGVLHTSDTTDYKLDLQCPHHHPISSLAGGSGLVTATRDVYRSPNVLESPTLKPNPPPASLSVDGLMSCTESLGFESSNFDDQVDQMDNKNDNNDDDSKKDIDDDDDDNKKDIDDDDDDGGEVWRRRRRMEEGRGNLRKVGNYCNEKKKVRSFPPPLSSLNRNGQPSFFLRPVRKDGRLELTEVRIHRPEILHASRHDGRLTLHLIPDQSILEEEEQEAAAKRAQEEEEEEELVQEEEAQLEEGEEEEEELVQEEEAQLEEEEEELVQEEEAQLEEEEELLEEEEVEEEIIVEEEEEEEEEGEVVEEIRYWKEEERVIGEWRFPLRGNEGLRRCHEMVNQHHHGHGSHHQLRIMCGVSIV